MSILSWSGFKNFLKGIPPFKDIWQARRMVEEQRNLFQLETARHLAELAAHPRYSDPKKLNRHEAQVFSQGGEDGIVSEIFRRIGTTNRVFVEIGIGDTLENNTIYPLALGWSGFWIDGGESPARMARRHFSGPIREGRLKFSQALVTADNAPDLLREMGVPAEFDLLSLDIDRNTYWVWAALRAFKPRAVVMEYNPLWPAEADWKVRYDAGLSWNGTAYFGASLKAMELLGRELGYALVGCSLSGVNAFFVRVDLLGDKFCAPFSAENHYEPSRYYLLHRPGHPRCFDDNASS